jgi:hypothetical protein
MLVPVAYAVTENSRLWMPAQAQVLQAILTNMKCRARPESDMLPCYPLPDGISHQYFLPLSFAFETAPVSIGVLTHISTGLLSWWLLQSTYSDSA